MESSMEINQELALNRYQYFKQIVDRLQFEGGLEGHQQRPISQATLDFLISRKKDPVSMLNIYCSASGQGQFDFYPFMLSDKRQGPGSKFLYLTELDGHPVYGICASSKKEAKKACALRLLDNLMTAGKLDCINENGRKVKRTPPKPLSLPVNMASGEDFVDGGNIEEQYGQQQLGAEMSFADDIDLDQIRQEFEKLNPVPEDWKESEASFNQLRSNAFRLHCANAFWRPIQLSNQTLDKMAQYKMANMPVAFVKRCLTLVADERSYAADEQLQQQQLQGTVATEQPNEHGGNIDAAATIPKLVPPQLDFVMFTLPYTPPKYACLAQFDGQIHHGTIGDSKQKAKSSCAEALAELCVQRGWVDIKARKKATTESAGTRALKRKKPKRNVSDGQEEQESECMVGYSLAPHQYLLTLHPNEKLDQRTHFLLSEQLKTPVQLLNEIAQIEQLGLSYTETTEKATGKFIARVDSIDGADFGCAEQDKQLAKYSAARKALDALVKAGRISVPEMEFAKFRSDFVSFCRQITEEKAEDV